MPTHSARNGSNGSKPPKAVKVESAPAPVPEPNGAAPVNRLLNPVELIPVSPTQPVQTQIKLPLPTAWPHPAPLLDGTPEEGDPELGMFGAGAAYQAIPPHQGMNLGLPGIQSDEAPTQPVYKTGFNPVGCVTSRFHAIQESPPYIAVSWDVEEQPISCITPDGESIPPPPKCLTRFRSFIAIVNATDPDEVILREPGKSQTLPYAHCVIPALLQVVEAVKRARKLLWDNLSPTMQEDLALHSYFTVQGEYTKRLYRLKVGRSHNVERLGHHGRPEGSYCIHVRGWIPAEDSTLVMKLILESNEREFLRTANFMRYAGHEGGASLGSTVMEAFLQRLEQGDPAFGQFRGIQMGEGALQPYVDVGPLPYPGMRLPHRRNARPQGPNQAFIGNALQRMVPQIAQLAQQAVQPGGALEGIGNVANLNAELANIQ